MKRTLFLWRSYVQKGNCRLHGVAGTLPPTKKKGKHNINWKPLNLQTGSMVGR
jgi:hypothetical protein